MNAQADQSGHPGSKEGYAAAILEKYLRYLSDRKNRSALTLDSYSNDLDQFAAFLAESDNAGRSDQPKQRDREDVYRTGERRPKTVIDRCSQENYDETDDRKKRLPRGAFGQFLIPGDRRTDHGNTGDRQHRDRG